MSQKFFWATAILAIALPSCTPKRSSRDAGSGVLVWKVPAGRAWMDQDEVEFSSWVQRIGESREAKKCKFFGECLKNPDVNSLFTPDDNALETNPNCADVPLSMRAYFAYKKKLPFVFVAEIDGKVDARKDLRYGTEIHPTRLEDQKYVATMNKLFFYIRDWVSSAFYRMSPEIEGNDTFPVKVTREAIRPGTIYYDPNGHVMMVYRVESDGTVRIIQGSPGDEKAGAYFSTGVINSAEHARGRKINGGGFRNWRGIKNVNGLAKFRLNSEEPQFDPQEQYQDSLVISAVQTVGGFI